MELDYEFMDSPLVSKLAFGRPVNTPLKGLCMSGLLCLTNSGHMVRSMCTATSSSPPSPCCRRTWA